jgi:hypothetical protein
MRIRRVPGVLAPTLALVVAAGCGGGGADADAVAWTDEVCVALTGFTQAVTAQPQIDRADPVAAVDALRDYFASTSAALQTSINELDRVGNAPVEGGDAYADQLRENMRQMRASFDASAAQLADVDTSSPASVTAALPAAVAPLQELGDLADPTEGLPADGELRAAFEEAPHCQQLRAESPPAG